jgi:hypothetical protein
MMLARHRPLQAAGRIIIIINPCKPYLGIGNRASPAREAESRLIILSIFGVR